MDSINYEITCSACPLQIEGTVNGRPFYFRARWNQWTLGVGDDPIGDPTFYLRGDWNNASWMSPHAGIALLKEALAIYKTTIAYQDPTPMDLIR